MAYPFVESPNATETPGRAIDLVVMHTMEIRERAGAAAICARWFASPVSKVSAHYCVDALEIVQCVREKDVAWHARGANMHSIGVELAGFAAQSERDWADDYSTSVLTRASRLVADLCLRWRIPPRWLVAGDLLAGRRGITGHSEVSRAYGKSDHWDPGPGFPVASFLDRVRRAEQAERARGAVRDAV